MFEYSISSGVVKDSTHRLAAPWYSLSKAFYNYSIQDINLNWTAFFSLYNSELSNVVILFIIV